MYRSTPQREMTELALVAEVGPLEATPLIETGFGSAGRLVRVRLLQPVHSVQLLPVPLIRLLAGSQHNHNEDGDEYYQPSSAFHGSTVPAREGPTPSVRTQRLTESH